VEKSSTLECMSRLRGVVVDLAGSVAEEDREVLTMPESSWGAVRRRGSRDDDDISTSRDDDIDLCFRAGPLLRLGLSVFSACQASHDDEC
jgi:hypothetical protein